MPAIIASARPSRLTVALVFCIVALFSVSASGVSQELRDATPAPVLPVTAVNLFTSGVGYFQHDGVVTGNTEIQLTFSTGDVNDLLKSLVLQDFDGGTVEAVTYPSQDPLARILGSFSLDISDNPSFAELINRARGAEVGVEGSVSVTGTVSGVEYRTVQTDAGSEREAYLNLLTSDGLRQVAFSEIRSLRFTDPALQDELAAALEVISDNRQQDRKTITIRFTGEGERRVRVGYVRAVPVWKTSYRVVLGDDGRAQIQGWAIVENTSEADWTGVSLGLVSGQPISFVMDLYSPIYRSRPRVAPEVGVAVAPPQFDRDVPVAAAPRARSGTTSAMAEMESLAEDFAGVGRAEPEPIDLSRGVSSAASLESGAFYRIDHPVSISRRGAALIPIVSTSVPVERLAVFDRSVIANRPLSSVELTNETALQLPAGPATLFDGANYAGDVRFPEMVAGEDRLLSYAVDLGSTIVVRPGSEPEEITEVRIVNGVLRVTARDQVTTEYVIERLVPDGARHLVVHPRRAGWDVIGDTQPASQTESAYRFRLPVDGGATATLTVVEERVRVQQIGIDRMSDDQIGFYLSQRVIDSRTARRLERIRELRAAIAEAERDRRRVEQQINDIYREQERIRANLNVLDADTDLYRRYLEAMSAQEERLAGLQQELEDAREREAAARDAFREYFESL